MRNVLLVAKREYLEQIRARAFLMSTIGLPAIFAIVLGIAYVANLGLGSKKHLVISTNNPALANEIRSQITSDKASKTTVDVIDSLDAATESTLKSQLQSQSISGVLTVESRADGLPSATYISLSSGDFINGARLRRALIDGLIEKQLKTSGMKSTQADSLLKGVSVQTFQLKKDGSIVKTSAEASFWKGYVMAILLSMTTMIYGLSVARSIIREKTSRIFEVMLSIVKPSDMLA